MKGRDKIRYAVVGLGYISQSAVLPAFQHAKENSELAALVSDDPVKLKELGKKYGVSALYTYDQYDDCLNSGDVDAVYIALPNTYHCEYSVRAALSGVHVLCEKPMAVTEEECERMIEESQRAQVKLMIAYRLHFERANLKAIAIARAGELGELRLFTSLFTMQVQEGNSRLKAALGGGTLYDIGIYCINAARNLFEAEPTKVMALSANNGEKRFQEVDEMTAGLLFFPEERLGTFISSFGAADTSSYDLLGTKGVLRVDPAYEIAETLRHTLKVNGKTRAEIFPKRDQFAPELVYFSDCILTGRDPEPSGREGLADVRIIRALYESARTGRPVELGPFEKKRSPGMEQEIRRAPVGQSNLIHAQAPSQ